MTGMVTVVCHVLIALVPLMIVFREKWIFILICIGVILLISVFIIYDTQVTFTLSYLYKMIAGGKKYGLSYDDYIIGALLLYTVIQIPLLKPFRI